MIAIALKSTLAVMLALAVTLAMRRSSASVRHLTLASLFGFLLLLPLVQRVAPRVEVPLDPQSRVVKSIVNPVAAAIAPAAAGIRPEKGSIDVMQWLLRIHLAVALLLVGWLASGVWRLRRLADSGEVWLEGTARMNEIANDAGIRRAALVTLSTDVSMPLTFGFRKSIIVLPADASEWPGEELARALRHELEHVRRDDWAFQLVARAAAALYWSNPLVWIAWRRFCLEAERACDDAVVKTYSVPESYAGQLISLARQSRRLVALPALGMASPSRLALRVHAILDRTQRRGPHGRVAAVSALAVVLAMLASIAPAQLVTETALRAANRQGYQSLLGEAIVKAAEEGNIDGVQKLIAAGVDVNTVAEGDGTALIGAARGGQAAMVDYLIEQDADVNLASPGDGNPLIAAARSGHLAIVLTLLDRGARIDEMVEGDENALIQASGEGHDAIVRLLIDRGADVNARTVVNGDEIRTPLRMARKQGFDEIEGMLLAAGAAD